MRLPKAEKKKRAELNLAYAFATQTFQEAAKALQDALIENGFERQEVSDLITRMPAKIEELPLFAPTPETDQVVVEVTESLLMDKLAPETAAKVSYDTATRTLTLRERLDEQDLLSLQQCFTTSTGKAAAENLYRRSRNLPVAARLTPSQRGERFSIPVLAIRQGDLFEQFEETHFLERAWSLADCDALLSESEFPSARPGGQEGEITVTKDGHVETHFISNLQAQMTMLNTDQGWVVADLVNWLDRKIYHPDITPTESGIFLRRLVRALMDDRGLNLEHLVQNQFRVRAAAEAKIDHYRKQAHHVAFQALLLLDCETPLVVNPAICFSFDPQSYPYNTLYRGGYKFNKHYYPQVGDLKSEGEEFECAQFIDSLDMVKFWVRNLERRPSHSFWLQTSTDRFYPDFVCLLNDGRYLVVEYKGEHLWGAPDSEEKRDVGELWEKRSDGKCLFVMPKGRDFVAIKSKAN